MINVKGGVEAMNAKKDHLAADNFSTEQTWAVFASQISIQMRLEPSSSQGGRSELKTHTMGSH